MQKRFIADILKNRNNRAILERWSALALPDGWLVAGCLFQTVWNVRSGRAPEAGIKDYDLFYFDASDTSDAAESWVQARIDEMLGDLGITVEASNQARVHLWYESYFGHPYEELGSACDGIDRFLIPATCVGVRPGNVYAPNGLSLLYDGVLTMNALMPHRDLFHQKAESSHAMVVATDSARPPFVLAVRLPTPIVRASNAADTYDTFSRAEAEARWPRHTSRNC